MSRHNSLETKVAALVEDVTFIPTPEQRRVKAVLWTALVDDPIYDTQHITRDLASMLTGSDGWRVKQWWDREPGFSAWLQNKDEFRQRDRKSTRLNSSHRT